MVLTAIRGTLKCRAYGCLYVAPHRQAMQRHFRTHCKPYCCPYVGCHRRFSNRAGFASHYRQHSNVKPYRCRRCDRTFASTKLRSDHEAMQHPDPDVPAEPPPPQLVLCTSPGCSFTTTSKRYLTKHKAVHQRPYKCVECSRAFATAGALRAHSATHDRSLQEPCPFAPRCKFVTSAPRYVRRHLQRCRFALQRRSEDDDALAAAMGARSVADKGMKAAGGPADHQVARVHHGVPEFA